MKPYFPAGASRRNEKSSGVPFHFRGWRNDDRASRDAAAGFPDADRCGLIGNQ